MENEIVAKINQILDLEYVIADKTKDHIADRYDLDSLSIMELYIILEKEFGISIPDKFRKMQVTVDDLQKLIQNCKRSHT